MIDQEQFEKYLALYKKMGASSLVSDEAFFKLAIQAPDVFKSSSSQELPPSLVEKIPLVIKNAINACDEFRTQEGNELESKLREYATGIEVNLSAIIKLDSNRIELVSERLKSTLANLELDIEVDKNR